MLLFINLLSLTERSTIVPEKSPPPPQAHLYDRTLEDTSRRRRAYTYQHQSGKLDTFIRPRTGKFDFRTLILVQGLWPIMQMRATFFRYHLLYFV